MELQNIYKANIICPGKRSEMQNAQLKYNGHKKQVFKIVIIVTQHTTTYIKHYMYYINKICKNRFFKV